MKNFSLLFPGAIHFGFGALAKLETIEMPGDIALIVTGGSSMKKNGFLDRAQAALEKNGKKVILFGGVEPEVSVDTVDKAASYARRNKADIIVGLGGGSALDCAKAVSGIYKKQSGVRDYIDGKQKVTGDTAFFIAIPSTAGTGSEVTKNAVLTYPEKSNKLSLRGDSLVPRIVIDDPELTLTMPPGITAYSGLDALSHAVESYFSTGANAYTKQLSASAVKMIFDNLPQAYSDGGEKQARYNMMLASLIAGMAFANAGLGAAHGIGHTVGAVCGIPHGLVNAILLPYVEEYNARAVEKEIMELEKITGKGFLKKLRSLNKKLKIPEKLGAVCSDMANKAEIVLKNISYSGSMAYNPVKMDSKAAEEILKGAV
jgi:alcohol dehydrogenase